MISKSLLIYTLMTANTTEGSKKDFQKKKCFNRSPFPLSPFKSIYCVFYINVKPSCYQLMTIDHYIKWKKNKLSLVINGQQDGNGNALLYWCKCNLMHYLKKSSNGNGNLMPKFMK